MEPTALEKSFNKPLKCTINVPDSDKTPESQIDLNEYLDENLVVEMPQSYAKRIKSINPADEISLNEY